MKIDLKQPKYIIPIILLPFMILLNYGILNFSREEKGQAKDNAEIQESIGDVSDQVRTGGIEDKLDAFRSRYKRADGYTAIENLSIEVDENDEIATQYNVAEKRMLDSIDQALRNPQTPSPVHQSNISNNDSDLLNHPAFSSREDLDFYSSLHSGNVEEPSRYDDPMELFRAQMSLIDSISKANDPEDKPVEEDSSHFPETPKLKVEKANQQKEDFNTITPKEKKSLIKAIVDEDLKKGTLGERLRIRLLDDIQVGGTLLPKGAYLYALITGYEAQRVKLSIASITVEDKIMPVQLQIYDLDGQEGLYVPSSSFREFSKDLGGNATGGMNIQMQQNPSSMNQFYMSSLQRLVTSTSQAMSKTIRQNKANLKYGSFIYLVDPQELNTNTEPLNP